MENFAEQCLDMAESLLNQNLESIEDNGEIKPLPNENNLGNDSGHAAFALGEYYRATNQTTLGNYDLIDLTARTITAQAFSKNGDESGLACTALGLLSFGSEKDRNPVWERLLSPTQEKLDEKLLERNDYENHFQAFNIAKSVARYSIGLSKKDETGKLIDRFLDRIEKYSTSGYFDDYDSESSSISGTFDISGPLSFIFIRQALQLHSNINLRDRKLASLRTKAEKYIKLIPDMVRQDGSGWCYGISVGAYGQMHSISILLQAMRDGWIPKHQANLYQDTVKKLFLNFFISYLNQEHGYLVIRDAERNTTNQQTNRVANFDAARYLCQWSRLIKSIGDSYSYQTQIQPKKVGRFVIFNKTPKKEQGLFLYQDPDSGLAFQLPLIAPNKIEKINSDYLAFPHAPGIFDWPVNHYMPIMTPELTFGNETIIPAFYGKNCTTKIGLRNALQFSYNQPDLITKEAKIVNGIGSCRVNWSFRSKFINVEYIFQVKNQIKLDHFRYTIVLSAPHSNYRQGATLQLGENGHNIKVLRDDFQAKWKLTETVSRDLKFRTYYGKIHQIQTLERDHPLIMRKGTEYRVSLAFEPDIISPSG